MGAINFITQGVSPEEKAAVEAILDAQIDEESALEHAVSGVGPSRWARSQRAIRADIRATREFGWDYSQ
ncbi:MAG: hypothetical protein JJE28_05650 [Actinomycetales bacterium]|nr:hypothetical protein [Actinomycetales bacterium]